METILIITKKKMFSDSSKNYIRNKVRKFKNPFFDISFNLLYIYIYIYIIFIHYYFRKSNEQYYLSFIVFVMQIISL